MNQIYFLTALLLSLFLSTTLLGQQAAGCDGFRYFYEPFSEINKTTVQYGENIDVLGINQELMVDVYEPVGDTVGARPLIIWAFGGAFITGSREDVAEACESFARRGYVAAAIDYRLYSILLGVPDSLTIMDGMVKGLHDLKASVRFFREDAATVNQFRIDPDRIIVAGVSAGGILALHAGYADLDDDIPLFVMDIIEDNGGFEGSSGDAQNLSYSSEAFGVVSLSGALYKKEWVNANEPWVVSMHGTEDEVVPYNHGITAVNFGGFDFSLISMDGSGLIHARADDLEIPNYLVSVPGGGHEDIYFEPQYESYRNDYTENGTLFAYERLCPNTPLVPASVASLEETANPVVVYPNPVADHCTVVLPSLSASYDVELFNAAGQSEYRWQDVQTTFTWQRGGLPSGVYWLVVRDQRSSSSIQVEALYLR
jgi:para-nitrobenzyl esterase